MAENNRSMKKRPKSIITYNKLLQMILDGVYPEGERLPSEPELAEVMGVSRMTLRQAMILLREDGIIEKQQGVGNFVRRIPQERKSGLERIEIPVYKCCTNRIDAVEVKYKIVSDEAFSSYFTYIFRKALSVALVADRYYYNNGELQVFSYSEMPIEVLNEFSIDLENEESVKQLLEKDIYTIAHRVSIEIKYLREEDWSKDREIKSKSNLMILLEETVYNNKGEVIIHNKFYFPVENLSFKVHFYNR